METLFPRSKRTYVRLKDHQLCGGDLHCFRIQIGSRRKPIVEEFDRCAEKPAAPGFTAGI
jgi:hypothetical protein